WRASPPLRMRACQRERMLARRRRSPVPVVARVARRMKWAARGGCSRGWWWSGVGVGGVGERLGLVRVGHSAAAGADKRADLPSDLAVAAWRGAGGGSARGGAAPHGPRRGAGPAGGALQQGTPLTRLGGSPWAGARSPPE